MEKGYTRRELLRTGGAMAAATALNTIHPSNSHADTPDQCLPYDKHVELPGAYADYFGDRILNEIIASEGLVTDTFVNHSIYMKNTGTAPPKPKDIEDMISGWKNPDSGRTLLFVSAGKTKYPQYEYIEFIEADDQNNKTPYGFARMDREWRRMIEGSVFQRALERASRIGITEEYVKKALDQGDFTQLLSGVFAGKDKKNATKVIRWNTANRIRIPTQYLNLGGHWGTDIIPSNGEVHVAYSDKKSANCVMKLQAPPVNVAYFIAHFQQMFDPDFGLNVLGTAYDTVDGKPVNVLGLPIEGQTDALGELQRKNNANRLGNSYLAIEDEELL